MAVFSLMTGSTDCPLKCFLYTLENTDDPQGPGIGNATILHQTVFSNVAGSSKGGGRSKGRRLQSRLCKISGDFASLTSHHFLPYVLPMIEELNISPAQSIDFYMDEQRIL